MRKKKGFSCYLQSAELLGLIAGNLCIDKLGEKEFSQLRMLKDGTEKNHLLCCQTSG